MGLEGTMLEIEEKYKNYVVLKEKATGRYLTLGQKEKGGDIYQATIQDVLCAFSFDMADETMRSIADNYPETEWERIDYLTALESSITRPFHWGIDRANGRDEIVEQVITREARGAR